MGKFRQLLTVICPPHHSGGVLSFNVYPDYIFFSDRCTKTDDCPDGDKAGCLPIPFAFTYCNKSFCVCNIII